MTTTFLNLQLSGINPAAVAWYEFLPASDDTDAKLNVILTSGEALSFEGDGAQCLFDSLQSAGSAILPLSEEKQNALDSLRAFFVGAFNSCPVPDANNRMSWIVTNDAKTIAEQALSVLSA